MMRRTKDTPYPLSRLIVTTEMKVANTWRRPEYVNFIYMITKVVGCDEIRLPPYALFRICEFRLYARRATAFAFLRADCLLRPGRRRPEYVHFAYMRGALLRRYSIARLEAGNPRWTDGPWEQAWKAYGASPRPCGSDRGKAYSLSMSMEHLPEGMGRVFFFLPRTLIVK